jgi:hypothetical protein
MMTNPRIGLRISLFVGAAAALWLFGLWPFSDQVWAAFGMVMHAITFVAIFLLLSSAPVALLFRQLAAVRADLLAGRNVIARWRVEPSLFEAHGKKELARDEDEKRFALFFILALIAASFGAIALFDPRAASGMAAIGTGVCVIILAAWWLGGRATRERFKLRSGEVIVGERGLLVNDVLHVWGTYLSWLSRVEIEKGPPPALLVTYAYLARHGSQPATVSLPLTEDQMELAHLIQSRLRPLC